MSLANKQSPLSEAVRFGAVMLVVCLGIWGCSRKPAAKVASADRKQVKLEQEYRTVQDARDKAKKELASLEEKSSRLQKEMGTTEDLARERDELKQQVKSVQSERDQVRQSLAQRTSERDDLKQQVSARLSERDAAQSRCERLRKGLQSLMNQDETFIGATPVATPCTPTAGVPPAPGPSVGGQS
jgi:predicted  nucleic acid-binding Zn-ribbon protein